MTAHAPTAKLSLLALSLSAGAAAASCGPAMGPCLIDTGSYHIVVPDGDAQHGAVLFLHGFGSSGEGALRNTGMVRVLLDRGYAVIAPDGQQITGRDGRSWDFLSSSPAKRNDTTFIKAVADDAVARFHLNRDKMLLAGFSLGGSMVSYIACAEPNAFAAFAPVAGSFWEPQPSACAGPVRLMHTHGWLDKTVPLEGRAIRSGFVQGDVFSALKTWRETNLCTSMVPDSFTQTADMQTRRWTSCAPASQLEFVLHFNGHSIPQGWSTLALDWFEQF